MNESPKNNDNNDNSNINEDNIEEIDEQTLKKEILKIEYENIVSSDLLKLGFDMKVSLETPDDYTSWIFTISAPDDSDYKGGHYKLSIKFGDNYPEEKPEIKFVNKIYHCNVNEDGEIDVPWLNNLKKGRKIAYILPRLITLFYLQDTEVENEISELYQNEKNTFDTNVKEWVEKYAKEEFK